MKKNVNLKAITFAGILVMVFALLILLFSLAEDLISGENPENPYSYSQYDGEHILIGDKLYIPRDDLETMLILGIDSMDGDNSQQADFAALIIMDETQESFRILHLNRDTITDIPQIDAYGKQYGTYRAQLTLAHTYGSTDKERCRNMVDAVENLLYDIHIDHYLSMTMDALPILNDSIGGVTLSLMDDFTYLDESFTKDAVVTLTGEQALAYVRARGALEDSSNLRRMERQQQYIGALFEKYSAINSENTLETMMKVNDYVVSDCTVNQLTDLLERVGEYTFEGITTLPGEAVVGAAGVMEYHLDEAAAQKTVIDLFYQLED